MPLRIALLFGGPSPERGISLNSARSVADHLEGPGVELAELVYVDGRRRPFRVTRPLLYSNTPDDFDFKLSLSTSPLAREELLGLLRGCDLAFPVMHGAFGEDGEVQAILEEAGVAYVGSDPVACAVAYDKLHSARRLAEAGLPTIPTALVDGAVGGPASAAAAVAQVDVGGPMVVKPAAGGSSLGVEVHAGAAEAAAALSGAAARHGRVVVQPWVEGVEFTTVVISGPAGPVALAPVEIEMVRRDRERQILSYRHKYLPSEDTRYHCPPRVDDGMLAAIRSVAERAFTVLGLRDFARVDARVTPAGEVLVSDVNPISGMEQNSFLFIAAAQAGMSHRDVLRLVVAQACARSGIRPPRGEWREERDPSAPSPARTDVLVLFGGATAERQVSVLSGTNVWLKLLHSERYRPVPALLDRDGKVWLLSYAAALRHTVEEIVTACEAAAGDAGRSGRLGDEVARALHLEPWQRTLSSEPPRHVGLEEAVAESPFVFIALHGGDGENGTLQAWLDERSVPYNGSGPEASALAMDKYRTGEVVEGLGVPAIASAPRVLVEVSAAGDRAHELWDVAVAACGAPSLVVKPLADGCSAGVVPLAGPAELATYLDALRAGDDRIGAGRFTRLGPDQVVELPAEGVDCVLLEAYVETDRVASVPAATPGAASSLVWGDEGNGWVEVTAGVIGRRGQLRAFLPSMTIANAGVLSLEEKFMGGTGVNITPPPAPPLGRFAAAAVDVARRHIEAVAEALGIEGYARIDAFVHRQRGDVIVIEANTLPGLTPSTVLYHQALAEEPPVYPRELLERIIGLGRQRERRR